MYALIDANNFYASCERAFAPKLEGKPVIVLSNNDGCVIARSNEAKGLGIKMGAPYFKVQHLCKQKAISVFSSNYSLYGDMSSRIVSLIKSWELDVEVYSIDEVFVRLKPSPHINFKQYLLKLRAMVYQATGIPLSIGIGQSKTLAKIASFQAKKLFETPVCILDEDIPTKVALKTTPINEVWGVGRQWSRQLLEREIKTAWDLSCQQAHVIKRQFNSVLADTVRELQGESCLPLELVLADRKNILSSKSFGQGISSFAALAEALANYIATAAKKLRAQNSLTQELVVFLNTNRFKTNAPYFSRSISVPLPIATDDTGTLIHYAKIGLRQIYKAGLQYQKTGVLFTKLAPNTQPQQLDLFQDREIKNLQRKQQNQVSNVMDTIQKRFGQKGIFIASERSNTQERWQRRSQFNSPHYTTRWEDIVNVQ